ncbi:MAG: protein kinase [Anaerolineae bacterium]|nr:protein kinase [Anaerolineae bacterium]
MAAPPPRDFDGAIRTGTILQDRYRILGVLGMGGMGAVYEARDLRFPNVERRVAVKELQTFSTDPNMRQVVVRSFEREADNLASLDHPAIPKIYDYFSLHDRVYLVMEYIQGQDLETTIGKTPGFIKTEIIYNWAIALCDVLHYLHSHQPEPVVFRDVKPANIMIDQHRHLRLIDFGIAKTFEKGREGTMIGSIGYAPPEQYRGEATPSGDIYALGATLHYLLTKKDPRLEKPFSFHDRPIREFNPTVSTEFAEVIMRALAYEPVERFVDAALMKAALEAVNPLHGETSQPAGETTLAPPLPAPRAEEVEEKISHKDELKLILKRSPLLRALMKAAPDIMMAAMKDEFYKAGTVLFRQGDPGDRVYAIWSGRLRVQYEMGGGAPPLVVGERLAGDLVGEMSLLENQPRSATVVVIEDARLVSLSRENFQRLIIEPEINLTVLRTLSQRLRGTDEQLVEASRSVDFLAKRLSGTAMLGTLPFVPGAGSAATPPPAGQWEGLSALFQTMNEFIDDMTNGLDIIRQQMPDSFGRTARDLFGLLYGQTQRMSGQLSRIRDWQQLTSGEIRLAQQGVMVGAVVERAAARLEPSARMLGHRFTLSLAPHIPLIKGDDKWLAQAVTEVIKNAMQYAPPDSAVEIEVSREEDAEIQVSVADWGRGVPSRYRKAIFEPFVRAPNAEGAGLGMGLALCKAVVEAHGGRVYVEDTPDDEVGCTVVISLPVETTFSPRI